MGGATYGDAKAELTGWCHGWNYTIVMCESVLDQLFKHVHDDQEFDEVSMCAPMLDLMKTRLDYQSTMPGRLGSYAKKLALGDAYVRQQQEEDDEEERKEALLQELRTSNNQKLLQQGCKESKIVR